MSFHVGQKVVCVDENPVGGVWPKRAILIKGREYTIRSVGQTIEGSDGVKLEELELSTDRGQVGNISNLPFVDRFFRASRFRPVTDISIFTAMLDGVKQREPA